MSKNLIPNSHDSLFKLLMQDKTIAQEFVELYLPEDIKTLCDLTTLAIEPTSFIEPNLRHRINDILYSVNTQNGKGYIYCLIEHQSKPDKLIAFRLMHYAIMAMENHLKQGHKKLPLVVPLLFYCGKKPHPKSISLNWHDLFDNPTMSKKIYGEAFKIIDVSLIEDEEIKTHKRLGILEYLLKHIHTRDLLKMVKDIGDFLLLGLLSKEQQKSILIYAFNQGRIEESQTQAFIDSLAQQNLGDDTMATTTVAEYLHKKGMQEGMQLGMKEVYQTTLSIAKNMLNNGADINFVKLTTGLSEEEIKQLQL